MNDNMLHVQVERTAAPEASNSTARPQIENPAAERSPPPEITSVRKVQHDAPEETAPKRRRVAENHVVAANSTSSSTHGPSTQTPEVPKKRWTARGWYAKQYFALADAAWNNFPFQEFQETHKKTREEVWDVFMGLINLPLLKAPGRGSGVPRGGLGEDRMKEMRSLEKEGRNNIREEDERMRKQDAEEERKEKIAGPHAVLCKNCKIESVRRPATIEEAQADVRAVIEEFNRRSGILERMIEKAREKEARENTE
ncbi:hypothetical protein MMC11_005207 [Xylographa trunciseda]|nr:hypothetical protein [Xylographa trunciseda]